MKYNVCQNFYLKIFIFFLVVKFSIYLNRRVFVMRAAFSTTAKTDLIISEGNIKLAAIHQRNPCATCAAVSAPDASPVASSAMKISSMTISK